MKHRTVTVLFVAVAALAVAPQAFQRISTLKAAAGNRLHAGIWNALVSLHGQKVEGATVPTAQFRTAPGATNTEVAAVASRVAAGASEPPARPREKAVATARNAVRTDDGVALISERELAKLEKVQTLFAFNADSKERVFMRVPAAPLAAFVPAPPSNASARPAPEVEVRGLGGLIESGLRHVEKQKGHRALERVSAQQRAAAARAARLEGRRQGEHVFKIDPSSLHVGPEVRLPAADNGATY